MVARRGRQVSPGAAVRRAVVVTLAVLAVPPAPAAAAPPATVADYHADPARSGHYVAPGLTFAAAARLRRDPGFDGQVDGHVYAQPLFWQPPGGGRARVIVASETNVVTALDAATGRPVWRRRLGAPVPGAALPCGNIDPLGITGTPVIDPAAGALYLDAMVAGPNGPRHEVFGLRLADGAVLPGWPIDVGAALTARGVRFVARDQNQRAALALLDGRVFVAFGGHWGDCGRYRGIVVGLSTAPPRLTAVWMTRGNKGGIWAPGGISVADHRLYFATGNTVRGGGVCAPRRPAWPFDDGNGVFREPASLPHRADPRDVFAPHDYAALSAADLDLGGVAPLPIDLPDGTKRLLALGKDGKAYLLDRANLGGIGGAVAVHAVARGPIITAPAVVRAGGRTLVVFPAWGAACPNGRRRTGLVALAVTASALRPAWCAPLDGRGAPIVTTADGGTDPIVWAAGAEGDNRLHGVRAADGREIFTSPQALPGLRHFVTPMVAAGRIYLAGDGLVFAFRWGEAPNR